MADPSSAAKFPQPKLSLEELATRKWVSTKQLAKLLGISYQTARKLLVPRPGKTTPDIHAIYVGGQARIYEDELLRYMREGGKK